MTTTARSSPKVFDGWYVVASVFVLLMVNAGLGFYGLAVFLEAITTEQGLSISSVSFATSIFFVVSALAGRLVAPVIEKRDLRLVVAAGAVVAAIGLLMISRSTRLITLYPSYVVFALGTGMSGLVPGTTLVTRWFHVKRSVAVSIASTGLSVGALTVTVLAAWIIDRQTMSGAGPWLALIYLGFAGVGLIALWPDPALRGQQPDGGTAETAAATTATGISYDEAVKSRFFRLTTAGFIFAMAAQVGGIAQLAKLGSERVDTATGTIVLSTVAFASVCARLIGGVVAAKAKLILMTAVLSLVQGVALVAFSQSNTRLTLVLSALLFGATIGNLLMLQPLVIADRFGVASYPRIFAYSQLIVVGLGVAGGPYLLGLLRDLFSYQVSYLVASVLSATGAALFFSASSDS